MFWVGAIFYVSFQKGIASFAAVQGQACPFFGGRPSLCCILKGGLRGLGCRRRRWKGFACGVEWRRQNSGGAEPRGIFLSSAVTCPSPVSPAGSGPAPRWGASRTDRSGNGDRFAAERHWRSLTPLPRPYFCERKGCAGAGGGDYSIHLISKGALPPLKPPKGQGKRKVKETPPVMAQP